ncbi:hypothetical protein OU426_14265 [Frigidibacter sp. RF13]|uniref:hypothetical protein n=1 Tax=Frigidibacter sp. RF13 TaxID=2997340 RepID=UPI00226D7D40|nr:hypothetical protein [Frigidibacter sp. RF13]MCY1128024.1 hypothetical protein [Frigidibacter sp. RF13]
MFAPEGFISLFEIKEVFAELAREWRLANPHPDDPEPHGIPSDETFGYADPNWQREAAYCEWLMQGFLNQQERNLYASTSDGRAIKLAALLVQRHHVFDGPFEDWPKGWQSILDHVQDPFTFVNAAGYRIDLSHAKKFAHFADLEDILPFVAKVDGCPVCWPLPRNGRRLDWLELCGVPKTTSQPKLDLSPDAVSKRILQTWNENQKLTRSQIKDIVAPGLSARKFGIAWAIAVSANSKLSVPGRK